MWSLRRTRPRPPSAAPPLTFGAWVLRCFAGEPGVGSLDFAAAERAAANTAAALCGALFADRDALASGLPLPEDTADEAALVARRTAEGFRASLEDRVHTVITWPWEHLATRAVWEATRADTLDDDTLGLRLLQVSGVYVYAHRDQLETALGLWKQVAADLRGDAGADLVAMGTELFRLYQQQPHALPIAATVAGADPGDAT